MQNFEELLLLEGLGPRTLQSLALVSEVIYGQPTQFKDPARFRLPMAVRMAIPSRCLPKCMTKQSTLYNRPFKGRNWAGRIKCRRYSRCRK
ncbi:DUF763 domain-containing protein [Niabella sp. W65]|nr:DUF763 domain-containing protein [Niabella sp. W65]MCH7365200.1 DUF763 domain-containing protein [Niabella sp. W65]